MPLENALVELTHCPACQSQRLLPEQSDIKPNLDVVPNVYAFSRCADCTLVFLNPRPSSADLIALYDLLPGSQHMTAVDAEPGLISRIWQAASDPSYAKLLARLPQGRVLDVGCGQGDLVDLLNKNGRAASGVDFSATSQEAAAARGLDLRQVNLNVFTPEPSAYDGIVLRHVLEHIEDPVGLIARLRQGLKPGGVIVLETPHFDSITRKLLGKDWNGWDAPFHVNQFTAKAMTTVLRSAGLSQVKTSSFGAVDELRRSYGRKVGKEARYDLLRLAALPLYLLVGLFGMGSSLLATARRD